MAGIVEAHTSAAAERGVRVERHGFGAAHVRVEAGQPEQPRRAALPAANGDDAAPFALTDVETGQWRIRICHELSFMLA